MNKIYNVKNLNKFFDNVKKFLAELNKRPEIQTAQTQYNPNYPQLTTVLL